MNRYIDTYDDFVYRDMDNKYVFTKLMSDRNFMVSISMFFTELVNSDLMKLGKRSTIVVGGTYPFLNWRRHYYSEITCTSLQRIIRNQMFLNYVLTDRSIRMDEQHMCAQWNNWVFEAMGKENFITGLTNIKSNLKVFYNKNTSEDDLIYLIKELFGSSRVSVGTIDTCISIAELNRYVYKTVNDRKIPDKIHEECMFYLRGATGMDG